MTELQIEQRAGVRRLAATLLTQPWLWRAALLLLLPLISYLALSPKPPQSIDLGWEKLNHCAAFAALMFASVLAMPSGRRSWALGFGAMLLYGVAIEIAQSFVPMRSADWRDLLADALGALLGLTVLQALRRWVFG